MNILIKYLSIALLLSLTATANEADYDGMFEEIGRHRLAEEICVETFKWKKEKMSRNYREKQSALEMAQKRVAKGRENPAKLKRILELAQKQFERVKDWSGEGLAKWDHSLQHQFIKAMLLNSCNYHDLATFKAYQLCFLSENYIARLPGVIKKTFATEPLEGYPAKLAGHDYDAPEEEEAKILFGYPAINQFRAKMLSTCKSRYGVTAAYDMSMMCELGLAY